MWRLFSLLILCSCVEIYKCDSYGDCYPTGMEYSSRTLCEEVADRLSKGTGYLFVCDGVK